MRDLFGKIVALRSLQQSEPAKPKNCRLCGEAMNESAVKCTTCGAFDGWRRFFPASGLILSLLVALVSVIGAVGPKVVEWLHRHSDTTVYIVGGNHDELFVMAANNGNKPAAIRQFRVHFENVPLPDTGLDLPDPAQAFLLPKEHKLLMLRHVVLQLTGKKTRDDLTKSLEKGAVHLTADVRESNDREDSPSHRHDVVAAKQLQEWVQGCL